MRTFKIKSTAGESYKDGFRVCRRWAGGVEVSKDGVNFEPVEAGTQYYRELALFPND